MKQHPVLFLFVITCLLCLVGPGPVAAGGPIHGARAAGMGSAFIGVAEGPSAIAHNPAGLTQGEGMRSYGGVTALSIQTTYESPTGEDEKTKTQFFFPPHLYVVSDLGTENFDFGVGLHSIFGIGGRKWARDGLTRYVSTEENIATFTFNPTVAWKMAPWISVGVGADLMYSRIEAERMVNQSLAGWRDGRSNLEAAGSGWGYNAGFLVRASESVRMGLQYRSGIHVDYKGKLKIRNIAPALQPAFGGSAFKTDVDTSADFPEIYGGGISFTRGKLTLAADVEVVRWSSFDRKNVDLEQEVPAAGVTDGEQVFDWKDSWQYKIGIEYRATDQYAFRTGYVFCEASVPEKTIGPGNPDSDQHHISIGTGYVHSPWLMDAFYQFTLFEKRRVNNSILSGDYETVFHMAGMSVGYQF